MTFSSLCYPECGMARPCPVTGSCNEPCVRQCQDSEVIQTNTATPLILETLTSCRALPGPISSHFSQCSAVGAVGAPVVGPRFRGSFGCGGYGGHYGGWYSLGRYGGYGGPYYYGGLGGYLGGHGYGGICGSGVSCHRYLSGNCGPC